MDNQPGQDESEDVWSRPNWPPRLEKILVELMFEEMKCHVDMYAGNFKEEAWDRVCKEFYAETGLNYDKTELKKHLAVLRKRYHIVKPLYNHGGFGWDYRRKMVDVDDLVWREYIEAYPKIKPYRKYGCPIYEELCTIFTKPIATGEYAIAVGGGSIWCSRGNINDMNGRNKRQLVEPMSSGANKRNCKGVASSKANATPEANSVSKPKGIAMAQAEDPHSAGHCISIINGMEGIDRRFYNAAVDLFQNPSWRKTLERNG